jgi:hypothetical protein
MNSVGDDFPTSHIHSRAISADLSSSETGFSFNPRHGGKGREMEGSGEQVHPEAVVLSAEY